MFIYIYADVLFAINFIADYLALYITSRLSSSRTSVARLLLASGLGALYACVIISINLQNTLTAIATVITSLLMCLVTFGKRGMRPFISLVFFFYVSSILMFGGAYALLSFISMIRGTSNGINSFTMVIALLLGVCALYLFLSPKITRGIKAQGNEVECTVDDGISRYKLRLICDSGNFAKDPFSGKSVTIVKKTSINEELYQALSSSLESNKSKGEYRNVKPRVIPIKTISGTSLLYAFIPKSVTVKKGNKEAKLDTIIAIDPHENSYLGRDGIIPYDLVEYL